MTPPTLRGADPAAVRGALDRGDPLPGTGGFAGVVDDTLVRDVLGREPLFLDADDERRNGPPAWSYSPADLEDPEPFPAGHALAVASGDGRHGADDRAREPRRVWWLPDPGPDDPDRAMARLERAVDGLDVPDCPVAFSGGVDSGLVAALGGGPLYVAGFPDSHDRRAAREAADAMGRTDLRVVELSHGTIREAVPRVVRATGRTNAMDLAIALPLVLVAEQAASDGFERLAVGQGADELFGGYAKVAGAPDDPRTEADTVRGATREVVGALPDQLARDVPAIRGAGVEPVAPLLDDRVVAAALALPEELLVDGDRRKVALRRVAREYVPDSVADRDKKAVQYGSLVDRELDRIARQEGFKRRMGDHVSKYVESLVE